ncbi:hypothetical protein GCM10010211_58310 [Streptomyces albospinus]|uniref:Uncharacterized protein n=2 Tax=Streptomyces albospinus TaxID=285515 RepID=A0ABQ2VGK4_9ACTN|nr:hypothetical protein GCM10010211_58310 [Streptomyces albospinus]
MGKAMRVVAGALGAGALLLSAAGTASAGGGDEVFDQHVRCSPSFSLLFPSTEGCRTNIFIDNQKTIFNLRQTAGGDISGIVVSGERGLGRGVLNGRGLGR